MLKFGEPEPSRYIRTTWMLSAETVLRFADSSAIRFFSCDEADRLAEQVRKRNVFARHSWENNFYLQRVKKLADQTIIEVFRPGDPKMMSDEAETVASYLEKITVLSTTIVLSKESLLRKLGINVKPKTETDFIFSSNFHFLRSRARPEPVIQGIIIDETFRKRFLRCGFNFITSYIQSNTDIAHRVRLSLEWLFDSRIEPRLPASVVKTSIALESLLIFSESESLAQSLSERAAFILTSDPEKRQLISRILKRFYDVRSGVVHGSQKKTKRLSPPLLETVDRLTVLLCLVIVANPNLWPTTENLREWCEAQRWGVPSTDIAIPFPATYLRNTLALGSKSLEQKT
jgi:hypothetical protein